MPISSFHIIRQQYLNIELNGSESDGLALQRSLPGLCQHWLTPAIERALERCAPPAGILCIERLEIDVGTIKTERLDHDLAKAVAEALEKSLRDLVPTGAPPPDIVSGNVQYKTVHHSINETFIYFLTTGSLPWSFRLPEGVTLEQVILGNWREAAKLGNSSGAANDAVLAVLASATIRKRLIRQFSPVFLEALLSMLSPVGKTVMDEALQFLRGSDEPPAATKQFEQHLWETAFAKVAAREIFTSTKLVGETWDGLPLTAAGHAALANVLDRCRPAMTNKALATTKQNIGAEAGPTSHGKPGPPSRIEPAPQSRTAPEQVNHSEHGPQNPVEPEPPSHAGSAPPNRIKPKPRRHIEPESLNQPEPRPPSLAENKHRHHTQPRSPGSVEPGMQRHIELDPQNQPEPRPSSPVEQNPQSHDQQSHDQPDSPNCVEPESQNHVMSRKTPINSSLHPEAGAGIHIENAGLVLLHPFLPRFFEALDIVAEDKLLQPERALCLLHFLTTGQLSVPEYDLVLPKILCNVPLLSPVESNVTLTATEQEEAVALLQAVVRHWEALRNTSPDGLRGTFLLRPGKVSLRDDGDWLLQVASKTCDILLDQLPWGISMTKLPWMESMIWVEWR